MTIVRQRNRACLQKTLLRLFVMQCWVLLSVVVVPSSLQVVGGGVAASTVDQDDLSSRDPATFSETDETTVTPKNDDAPHDDDDNIKPDAPLEASSPPVFTLTHGRDLERIFRYSKHAHSALLVVVAYRESCPYSMQFLWNFQYALHQAFYGENVNATLLADLDPIIVQLPVRDDTLTILDQFGVTHVPTLFFLKEQGQIPWDDPSVVGTEEDDNNDDEEFLDLDLDETESEEELEDDKKDGFRMVPLVYATIYVGLQSTIDDLVNGMYHYLTRLRHSTMSFQTNTYTGDEYLDSMTVRVDSSTHMQDMVHRYTDKMLRHVPIPIDPKHSDEEIEWVRFLLDDPATTYDDESPQPVDPFYVICQCRQNDTPEDEYKGAALPMVQRWYREFDQVASVLAKRRDTVFCVLPELYGFKNDIGSKAKSSDNDDNNQNSDGAIAIFTVHPDQQWKLQLQRVFHPLPVSLSPLQSGVDDVDGSDKEDENDANGENKDEPRSSIRYPGTGILEVLSDLLRPTVMWLDRRTTASIAFNHKYRRHAVLFVDYHRDTEANRIEMRQAVRLFRQECNSRRFYLDYTSHDDTNKEAPMVCLVVPSTDTRVLTNFGVDIWTPLDYEFSEQLERTRCLFQSMEKNESENVIDDPKCRKYDEERQNGHKPFKFSQLLPVVLVTNRRSDRTGIERFYLEPPVNKTALSAFFDGIFDGTAQREMHSTRLKDTNARIRNGQKFPSNKRGVYILNGESLPRFIEEHRDKHVLLNLHSPTCGHCKRFSIIWNELAELIRYIKWDDSVVVGRMDITVNEVFIPGLVANWLPAMFYFGPGVTENPVDYEKTKMAKDFELGGISNALDVIEWWMDEAGDSIDERSLLKSLEKEENNEEDGSADNHVEPEKA